MKPVICVIPLEHSRRTCCIPTDQRRRGGVDSRSLFLLVFQCSLSSLSFLSPAMPCPRSSGISSRLQCDVICIVEEYAKPMLILWLGVLFTDIRICAYKYPNKSISWLATDTGTDPGVIASKEVMPHLHNSKMKMLTIPFFDFPICCTFCLSIRHQRKKTVLVHNACLTFSSFSVALLRKRLLPGALAAGYGSTYNSSQRTHFFESPQL